MEVTMHRGEVREVDGLVDIVTTDGIEGQLNETLLQLRKRARGVRGSVVADSNGLTVASDVKGGISASILSAMSTMIAQSAGSMFENLDMPGPEFILMEGPESNVAVMHLGEGEATLLVLLEKSVNLGVMKLELQRAARGIGTALGFAFGHHAVISELFVMTKDGLLIGHYSDSLRTDLDRDILGGMLVAVQQFVQQTLASKSGSLDQLKYGQHTISFTRGAYTVAAAVARDGDVGDVQYRVMDALQDFEDKYGATLAKWNGDIAAFPGMDECFEKILKG
jgi:predicted regulator of Ras-like GTPase activity (Roadblock/LC7/MglB family)